MTTPPKYLSLDETAAEQAGIYECEVQHRERQWNENDYKYRDFQAGFKAGAAYQAGVEEKRVAGLVEALETASHLLLGVMKNCVRLDGIGMRDFGKCITQIEKALATYKSKGTK